MTDRIIPTRCEPAPTPLAIDIAIAPGLTKDRFTMLANNDPSMRLAHKFGLNLIVSMVNGRSFYFVGEDRWTAQPAAGALIQFGDRL